MHIPDGFLDAKTALATGGLAVVGLGFALRQAGRTLAPRKVPLLGLSAAFVFAAQMVNFPVIGGTSGHLVGAVLTAALLGPSATVIVLSTVLIVQCFAFADGGITALGANIFNMGIVGGVGGWAVYAALARCMGGLRGRITAAVAGAWVSTVLGAIFCAGELAASHMVAAGVVFPAMTGIHMLIGIGEGLITGLVLAAIASVRPELVLAPQAGGAVPRALAPVIVYGILGALGIGLFVAPFACQWPDGLERVAERSGFAQHESGRVLGAPLGGYQVPGLSKGAVAAGVAGGIGTLVVLALGFLMARVIVPRKALAETTDAR